jgi:hypothetical protein
MQATPKEQQEVAKWARPASRHGNDRMRFEIRISSRPKVSRDLKESRTMTDVGLVAVADAVRTSLGPRGMDKMIQTGNGEVTITNDGATILKQMSVIHPAAKMVRLFSPVDLVRMRFSLSL